MAISTVDAPKIVREYLITSGTDLYTEVSTNVFVSRSPKNFDGATTKGLVVSTRGGAPDRDVPLNRLQLTVKCFGGSKFSHLGAQQVYRALRDRLHGVTMQDTTSGTVLYAKEVGYGQEVIDPDTEWMYVLTLYEVGVRATS